MSKVSKRLLMIIFVALIITIGAATLIKAKNDIMDVVISKRLTEIPDAVERVLQQDIKGRNWWINLNGLAQKVMLKTVIKDNSYTVYKLKNGQVMYGLPERDMQPYAERLKEFGDLLQTEGIGFMYVQIPFKVKNDSYMPVGTHANGNKNADQLIKLLNEKKVNYLDLRGEISKEELDWTSLFFNTDHHWRPATGLWASGKIMKRIHDDFGFDIQMSYFEKSNYTSKWYKNFMLGAVGRRTGYWYSGLDDFELLTPKFETEFDFWGKSKEGVTKRKGDFKEAMFDREPLKHRADFERNTYSTYIGKNFSRNVIKNLKVENGLKILWIKESFSLALVPFIATGVEEITTIDLRRYKKKTMLELAKEYKPDVVIVAYNPSAFSKKQFNFLG